MSLLNSGQRRAGILLHPTSLPSGTLTDALPWLDFSFSVAKIARFK